MPERQNQVTQLLAAYSRGEAGAFDRLVDVVYGDLRGVAKRQLGRHAAKTLNTTGLVHEAYLELVEQTGVQWENRNHFFGIAASAMHQILVDHARRRLTHKRGAGAHHTGLDKIDVAEHRSADEVLAVHEALTGLADLGERMVRVVECRYFAGYTIQETAEALDITTRTVERDWARARAWLQMEMRS